MNPKGKSNRNPFAWPNKRTFDENGAPKTLGSLALAWAVAGPIVGSIFLAKQASEWWNDPHGPTKEWVKAQEEAKKLEQKFQKDRKAKKPKALLGTRPRALSISKKENVQEEGCGLYSRLPREVRVRIWELVVGRNTIAIFGGNRRLLHRILQDEEVDGNKHVDYSQGMPDFPSNSYPSNLSALLKTCRKIYAEAVPFLYTNNTFILYQNDTLTNLQSTTLPRRFTSIRFLALHFQFQSPFTFSRNAAGTLTQPSPAPFSPDDWHRTCAILSSMPSLISLFIVIRGPFEANSQIVEVLEGLREVKVVEDGTFKVRVPWPKTIARTGDEGVDRRFVDRGFAFEVCRPEDVIPDQWSGFEWARD